MTQQLTGKLDKEALLAKAAEVGQLAESQAMEAEKNTRISDEVAQLMKDGEFSKLWVPERYGGYSKQMDLWTYKEFVRTVSRHNMAAGWLAYFYSIHEVWVAQMNPQAREEILGHGGFVADVVAPLGKVEKDGDDYRLYGQWNYASGLPHSEWIGLSAIMELPDSTETEVCLLTLPVSDCTFVENWDSLGVRGTGSHGVIVDGAKVPLHMILPLGRLLVTGNTTGGDYDADEPIYRMPFMPFFAAGFPVVILGGAERVVSLFQEHTEKRVRVFRGIEEKGNPNSHRVMGELKMMLFELEGHVDHYLRILEQWQAEAKITTTAEEKALMYALRGKIAKLGADIAYKAIMTIGAACTFKGHPMELFTRDLIQLATHGSHLYEDSMSVYGGTIFGGPGSVVW